MRGVTAARMGVHRWAVFLDAAADPPAASALAAANHDRPALAPPVRALQMAPTGTALFPAHESGTQQTAIMRPAAARGQPWRHAFRTIEERLFVGRSS